MYRHVEMESSFVFQYFFLRFHESKIDSRNQGLSSTLKALLSIPVLVSLRGWRPHRSTSMRISSSRSSTSSAFLSGRPHQTSQRCVLNGQSMHTASKFHPNAKWARVLKHIQTGLRHGWEPRADAVRRRR